MWVINCSLRCRLGNPRTGHCPVDPWKISHFRTPVVQRTRTGTTSRAFPSSVRRMCQEIVSSSTARSKVTIAFYQLLSGQMKSDYFPIGFGALRAEISADHLDDGRKEIGGVLVESLPLNHPGGCLGYAFSHQSKKIVYATDNEIAMDASQLESNGQVRLADGRGCAGGIRARRRSAHRRWPIHRRRIQVQKGWGHTSCLTAVDWAVQSGVKQLAVFHHDPATRTMLWMKSLKAAAAASRIWALNSSCSPRGRGVELAI